jgi:serine/threonine-protein kinase
VGESSVAILDAKIKGSPEHPRDRAPARGIPAHVDELVMRALARHPSVRFQTAAEMRAAIEIALEMPRKTRAGRRTLGFVALAATMAFAAVLLVGKAKQIRAAVPFLHAPARTEMIATATPAAAPIPAIEPAPAVLAAVAPAADPAAGAREEDSDDGDFVDDTLPVPSLDAVAPPVAPEAAPPAKAKARKHVAAAKKIAVPSTKAAEPVAKLPAAAPAVADGDAVPTDKHAAAKASPAAPKAHHKHKGRVASKAP